jgi:hypothetical protein
MPGLLGKLSYDHRLAHSKNRKRVPPKTIIKTRKAICSGYTDLFCCDVYPGRD